MFWAIIDGWKIWTLLWKLRWIWTCCQTFKKFTLLRIFVKILMSAKSRWSRGNVDYVGAWVAWVCECMGCVDYVDQNNFYVGQNFTWVIIFTWVRGSTFFTWGSKFSAWVIFWGMGLKKFQLALSLLVLHEFRRQYFTYFFHLHYASRKATSKSKLK